MALAEIPGELLTGQDIAELDEVDQPIAPSNRCVLLEIGIKDGGWVRLSELLDREDHRGVLARRCDVDRPGAGKNSGRGKA